MAIVYVAQVIKLPKHIHPVDSSKVDKNNHTCRTILIPSILVLRMVWQALIFIQFEAIEIISASNKLAAASVSFYPLANYLFSKQLLIWDVFPAKKMLQC